MNLPLPERLQGTANEAAPVPTPHATEGAYHWVMERAVSVALIPITIAPFVGGSLNPTLDAVFCGLLVVHSHVGFTYVPSYPPYSCHFENIAYETWYQRCSKLTCFPCRSCITDYFPKKRTPKTRKTLEYTLLGASFLTAYGLWEFETNDVGLVEATRRIWKA